MKNLILVNYLFLLIISCINAQPNVADSAVVDEVLMKSAKDISKKVLNLDCHTHSMFLNLQQTDQQQKSAFQLLNDGWSIGLVQVLPANHCKKGNTLDKILCDINTIKNEILSKNLPVSIIENSFDIDQKNDQKKIKIIFAAEASDYCESDLSKLKTMYDEGIREIVINNGDKDTIFSNGKLTDFGKSFVKELYRLGIICDISHLREETNVAMDIIELSDAPVIISHSAVYDLIPSQSNFHIDVIEKMISKGGLIGIRFYPDNLSPIASEHIKQGKPWKEMPLATIEELIDQIDFLKNKFGIDNIGIGSDRYALGFQPKGLETMDGNILIIYYMLTRGYTEDEIEKIMGLNFISFWEKVEAKRTLD